MKELTYFLIPACPRCKLASRYLDELVAEDPRYADVTVRRIDETRERALADAYDYWYVPCFYAGREKLHEGHAEKADVRAALDLLLLKEK